MSKNKLWEGHRMILPEYRERVLSLDVKEKTKPRLDAEAYEKLEAGLGLPWPAGEQ